MKHLKNKANGSRSEVRLFSSLHPMQVVSINADSPPGRLKHGRNSHEECRFSAPAGTVDNHKLASFNLQGYAVQSRDYPSTGHVGFGHIFENNHRYSLPRVVAGSHVTAEMVGMKLETAAKLGAMTIIQRSQT